jgi:hypothetical protein
VNPNMRATGRDLRIVRRLQRGHDPVSAFAQFDPQEFVGCRTAPRGRVEARPGRRVVRRSSGSRGDPPDDPEPEAVVTVVPPRGVPRGGWPRARSGVMSRETRKVAATQSEGLRQQLGVGEA